MYGPDNMLGEAEAGAVPSAGMVTGIGIVHGGTLAPNFGEHEVSSAYSSSLCTAVFRLQQPSRTRTNTKNWTNFVDQVLQ